MEPTSAAITRSTFDALVLEQMDAVYRLAWHLRVPQVDADDLVQETYRRAFRSWETYRATARGPRPWLFRILHNVLRDRLTRDGRAEELIETHDLSTVQGISDPRPFALDGIDLEQIDDRIVAAIGRLPLPFREAFLMHVIDGLTPRELAAALGVAVGTIESRLSRARGRLIADLACHGIHPLSSGFSLD